MNRFLILILILILNIGCDENKIELPLSSRITSKYRVNERIICSDKSVPFLKMQEYDCSFSIRNYEFGIERKYLIDENGSLKKFWTYHTEGPITYSIEQLNEDVKFKKYENVENFNVKLSQNRAEIIDDNIVLKIDKHFENEKLILIEKRSGTDLKGRRILYEYK